jgi:hypothetical protein
MSLFHQLSHVWTSGGAVQGRARFWPKFRSPRVLSSHGASAELMSGVGRKTANVVLGRTELTEPSGPGWCAQTKPATGSANSNPLLAITPPSISRTIGVQGKAPGKWPKTIEGKKLRLFCGGSFLDIFANKISMANMFYWCVLKETALHHLNFSTVIECG